MIRTKQALTDTRQYKKYQNKADYVKIPKNFCTTWKLEPTLSMIYKIIESADLLEYACYTGSKNDLATITYTSPKTCFNALKTLEELGFVARVEIYSKTAKKYITAYKNLGTDCNLPKHKGKPFTPSEKLDLNKGLKNDILKKWQNEFDIQLK